MEENLLMRPTQFFFFLISNFSNTLKKKKNCPPLIFFFCLTIPLVRMGGLVTFEIAFRVAEPTQDCEGSLAISEIFFGAAYMGGLSLS